MWPVLWVAAGPAAALTWQRLARRRRERRRDRPQQAFRAVLADNSDRPFLHLCPGLQGLQSAGEEPAHPLAAQVARLTPADQRCLDRFLGPPPAVADLPCTLIDSPAGLQAAAARLAQADAIGVDLEHNHRRSYRGMTCLLQLSTGAESFIVDALALHDCIGACLRPIFADPAIVKVVHGGDNDVLWLQRDFHCYLANVFDTGKASLVLGGQEQSLAGLLAERCGVRQQKQHQLSDWRIRPLPADMLLYAVTDSHYLLHLAALLRRQLQAAAGTGAEGPSAALQQAFERAQGMSLELYRKQTQQAAVQAAVASLNRRRQALPAESAAAGSGRVRGTMHGPLLDRAAALCRWRDCQARALDEGLQHTLPDSLLLRLAEAAPATAAQLQASASEWQAGQEPGRAEAAAAALKLVCSRAAEVCQVLATAPPAPSPASASGSGGSGGSRAKLSRQQRRQLVAQKFSAKKTVYENCRMLGMDGQLLCYCDFKKVQWYEAKGLAQRVSEDPVTIRLTFAHKEGDQEAGQEAFYTASRGNLCVVCGGQANLLRYRVVPSCYRRHFPVQQKSHRSHDVLLLCFECHETAHQASEQVKRDIARELAVPLLPPAEQPSGSGGRKLPHPAHVRGAAIALRQAADQMPAARREELHARINAYFDGDSGESQPSCSGVSEARLQEALLAGLGPRQRRRTQARLRAEAAAESAADGEPGQRAAKEGSESDAEAGPAAASLEQPGRAQQTGHMWHGQQVVQRLLAAGGSEALARMTQRFRAAFVAGCQPRFLPPFWKVDHSAAREFGEFSIYRGESRQRPAPSDSSADSLLPSA